MIEILLILIIFLLLAVIVLQIILVFRKNKVDLSPIQQAFQTTEKLGERTEHAVRDEIAKNRAETSTTAKQSREELHNTLKAFADTLNKNFASLTQASSSNAKSLKEETAANLQRLSESLVNNLGEIAKLQKGQLDVFSERLDKLTQSNEQRLDKMRETIEQRLVILQEESGKNLEQVRQASLSSAKTLREETATTLKGFNESLVSNIGEMAKLQKSQLDLFSERLDKLTQTNEQKLDKMRETIEQRLAVLQEESGKKLAEMRQEAAGNAQKTREEVTTSLKSFNESVGKTIEDFTTWQRRQFGSVLEQMTKLTETNEKRLTEVRTAVEEKLKNIQEDNNKNLEQMRQTVDEKLQGTLEKRLGESFKLVSERLEQVHKGLGEMQTLATGVGDLKRVLTNVKSRGSWGEVQLERLLEQILTPEQYDKNVATKESSERVEFAIKLPGRGDDKDEIVWLPIDAKFPTEDYQRLMDAQEQGDPILAEAASKQLENRIKGCAGDICSKYLNPPKTTDFGILFLPTEGLFAEVLRRPGLAESLQRDHKVMVAGPTTLWSILNSLQMGFRTLAIQKRSSEVWNLLAAVKAEFSKYGEVLGKVQKKLQEASNTIDTAATRTRAIERKLRDVQELPASDASAVLLLEGTNGDGESEQVSEVNT